MSGASALRRARLRDRQRLFSNLSLRSGGGVLFQDDPRLFESASGQLRAATIRSVRKTNPRASTEERPNSGRQLDGGQCAAGTNVWARAIDNVLGRASFRFE